MSESGSIRLRWTLSLALLLCQLWATDLLAQSGTEPVLAGADDSEVSSVMDASQASSLEMIQELIQANLDAQQELRNEFKTTDAASLGDAQQQLDALTSDLKQLRESLEHSAIGSVDTSVFDETESSFDWHVELSQILMPIVDNLKALTEKPRKISNLMSSIERLSKQRSAIELAMENIDTELAQIDNPDLQGSLQSIRKVWKRRLAENNQDTKLAQLQLDELQNSDIRWWKIAQAGLVDFIHGRGLTLLLAAGFATAVWYGLRGLFNLLLSKERFTDQQAYRTRKRLAQYVFRAVSFVILLIVVIAVFYVRGDMLLLGLAIIAVVGVALGLRQAVPRFYREARLLLNLGSVRENERVMYNGLPWQVVSLNVHSILRNPELTGVVRLPLELMSTLVSRPAGKEPWFPASKGDYLMLEGGLFRQVIRLTPEVVELQSGGGSIFSTPTSEFYRWTFENLSRGETYAISATFGIDYQHQAISLTDVAPRFRNAIDYAIVHSEYGESLNQVQVELKKAGDSSLDFWIWVTMQRSAISGLFKLERMIQQACVRVCTEENWGIPFPHITVQQLPDAVSRDAPAPADSVD